jgi:formylglycine-generating enzyme required for sulfatase activity
MKRVTMTLLALAVLVGASTTQAGWRMRIHRGETIIEVPLSGVDNITFHESIVPVMVQVPAGTFTMGDWEAPCGVDEHQVTLTKDFYLGQHEVTNLEYMEALQWAFDNGYVTATRDSVQDALDGSTETLLRMANDYCEIQLGGDGTFYLRESPSSEARTAYPDGYDPAAHPVKMVSWYGAARYCDWLSLRTGFARAYEHTGDWSCNGGDPYGAEGFRLPTDAEWEYAAQYDDERSYPWGNEDPECSRANYAEDSQTACVGWTTRVGSYPAAPAELGLWDMAGNMSEMCNDWFRCDLGTFARTDPVGPPGGSGRVVRGGCWVTHDPDFEAIMPCAARGIVDDYTRTDFDTATGDRGFRAARTVTP